uniref:SXP/RAL-2 family protein Ani s 5-like cation-binding domain-containing protein n=1 Tax=Panagrolaimus sp. ES5 TaxID=591445 RepID=A0AC34GMX1_9BILA
MFSKTVILFAFLASTTVFALPLLGGGGVSSAPNNGGGDNGPLSGLLNGKLLGVLKGLPLNAGINGALGDLVTLVRTLLEKVFQILQQLLPSLSKQQLDELTGLLKNENMTKSEILETIDSWIAGQPIELQQLYKSIVEDVEGKIDATFTTLKNIANGISPE